MANVQSEAFAGTDRFVDRHIGPDQTQINDMLRTIGVESLDQLINQTIPPAIRSKQGLTLPPPQTEAEYLDALMLVAQQNKAVRSLIGQGYYGTLTPSVILRNLFQNPGWYTQYTPYQAEIAQGRLESLLNYQTVVSELTGLPIANASLLDEATAASEAMQMFYSEKNKRAANEKEMAKEFFVDTHVFQQTLDVVISRAQPHGIKVVVGDYQTYQPTANTFGALVQYPAADGSVADMSKFAERMKAAGVFTCFASDLMALLVLTPPGAWGADCVVGNSQRFGVPMGYGGPHAAFFSTTDQFKRQIPGRIIGVSLDKHGNRALRMALQTREQHIRREKATSNICTAQALLANMAAMYAVYHGPDGLRAIAERIHQMTVSLAESLAAAGYAPKAKTYFDTLHITLAPAQTKVIKAKAEKAGFNFFYTNTGLQISLDETVTYTELCAIAAIFGGAAPKQKAGQTAIPKSLTRATDYLQHPVFSSYHTESDMMRYLKRLENKDLSLMHSMISLGSCTMKLNAATEMIPVTWHLFSAIHPFAPASQVKGYAHMMSELEKYLCQSTGFSACSLQPNSGAQGEYAGLMLIRAYHAARKDFKRNIALIPSSAHGTNPASAVMAGMEVVVVGCTEEGNIDVADLRAKALEYKDRLSSLMVTYPSTHGVFEASIKEICDIIHENGGKVYMDGANMNAQVGLTSPAAIGADVCHLNLHKTFAIPHGGGGPGMGPICCNDSLAPYLPKHSRYKTGGAKGIKAVSAAPFGSASILLISYAYIRMLGAEGVKKATEVAILNANYIKSRLEKELPVLYTNDQGRVAHELIIDMRPFKSIVSAEDVAKRLMDYGFHAPTLSFPVAGTIMIEPTESESKQEMDMFCDALLSIKKEIDAIALGEMDATNNPLHNAPHTLQVLTADTWDYPYTRQQAAWPIAYLHEGRKFWPSVSRIDQAVGDRNLICVCPPIEAYQK
jgi:glycine dehydrogenase